MIRSEGWSTRCPPGWSVWQEGRRSYRAIRDGTDAEGGPNRPYPFLALEDALRLAEADRDDPRGRR